MNYEKRAMQIYELLVGTNMSIDSPIEVLYASITEHYNQTRNDPMSKQSFLLVQAIRTWVHEMKEEIEL